MPRPGKDTMAELTDTPIRFSVTDHLDSCEVIVATPRQIARAWGVRVAEAAISQHLDGHRVHLDLARYITLDDLVLRRLDLADSEI